MDRRSLLKLMAAGAGLAGLPAIGRASEPSSRRSARVVVVGGGFGGAIAAKYLRKLDPSIEVILVDRNREFVSCPFSNRYVAGIYRDLAPLTIGYDKLAANYGIKLVFTEAAGVDPVTRTLITANGTIRYDRLILSPGIVFRNDEIEGYDERAAQAMPHAWKAGDQSTLLRRQLQDMPDGGSVIISSPAAPYRCPPAPYERACLIAHYLKANKPKSKLIVLDANADIVAKKPLFQKAWYDYYKGIVEYQPGRRVTRVSAKDRTVFVEGIEEHKAEVVNLIPPQRAGLIAARAGVVGEDRRWCPVDPSTFESTLQKDIHVIGDACIAGPMPKSAYSANSQAKACALNIVAQLNGREVSDFAAVNVCYSALNDHESVSVAAVYKVVDGKIAAVPNAGGISPTDFSQTRREHAFGEGWLRNILVEMSS